MPLLAWISTSTHSVFGRTTRRRGKICSSIIDELDRQLVCDCVDQAQLADLEAYGHLHFPSHEEALHKIIGLVMLDDPLPRERIAFGERRVWSRSQIFFLLCLRVICPTPMSPCNNIKQERQKLA